MKTNQIKKLTVLSMICALGFIAIFFFRFNVGFLTFDFKDAVMSVGAFLYGPVAGLVCSILVPVLESVTVGDTGPYGLIMDILSSASFLVPCGLVYKYKRSFSGAIFAAISAIVSVLVVMTLANIVITPLYTGVSRTDVVGMIPTLLFPFNLSKVLMNSGIMLLIYKPVTQILRKTRMIPASKNEANAKSMKTIWLAVGALIVLVIGLVIVVYGLEGNFDFFGANS
ncbi:MAG: ECF transporter S component [Clostridia bacterium]|nr:ECF transporter S component [Clostridia bacterium]